MSDPSVLYPDAVYGTLGSGVDRFQADGDFQAIPNRTTPPLGEPPLYDEAEEPVYPLDPPINTAAEDELLHAQMHGAPWRGYRIQGWVNPSNPGIPNLGPVNDQPYVSGHSQITVPNPSAEQGWGLDPAILLARYPHSEGVNPFYATGRHRRNGQMEFTASGLPFGNIVADQTLTAVSRGRSTTHQRLADTPASIPYSSTVPVGGSAGPIPNLVPDHDEAIY